MGEGEYRESYTEQTVVLKDRSDESAPGEVQVVERRDFDRADESEVEVGKGKEIWVEASVYFPPQADGSGDDMYLRNDHNIPINHRMTDRIGNREYTVPESLGVARVTEL